ncbi:MAG: hypothetical protein SVY53_14050 [Chloroflexota bacterium]|nr:hypothetical protein [Chloroflexota bacterium]
MSRENTKVIRLNPTLDHCIETTAKSEYKRITEEYIKTEMDNRELEYQIELLRMFLETTDFRELRKETERFLLRGDEVVVNICLIGPEPKYEIELLSK